MHFLDLNGQTYSIPDDVLAKHEVKDALPDVPLTGLEVTPQTHVGVEGSHCWRIQRTADGRSLCYVLSVQPTTSAPSPAETVTGLSVSITDREVVIRFGESNDQR